MQMADTPGPAGYQKLTSLQDIKQLQHLTSDNVRDILRTSLRDSSLEIVELGELKDMSGTNDAFNSSICSLQVKVSLGADEKGEGGDADNNDPSSTIDQPSSSVSEDDLKAAAASSGELQHKTFDMVVKSPPKASFMRLMHKITKPFLNEVTWYLDMMKQVELVENNFDEEMFSRWRLANIVPECYHAYSNYYCGEASDGCQAGPWFCSLPFRSAEDGILLLENVTKRGYKLYDKRSVLPLDHFLLAMSDLAHFHGRWLVYRWQSEAGKLGEGAWTPSYLKKCLNTQKRAPRFVYKKLLSATRKTMLKILELENMTEYSDRVRKFFNVTARAQLDQFMGEVSTPVDTCCHGDFWSNNILYKYDEDDKVVATMLIDFQLINYGHPAYDVLYLLYISSDIEFRDAHMEACLEHYWKTFSVYLEKYGPDDVKYSWSDFKADVQIYKSIVFVLATTLLPNVLSDIQVEAGGLMALRNLQRKQAQELADTTKASSKEIKRRIVGLVKEMARENII